MILKLVIYVYLLSKGKFFLCLVEDIILLSERLVFEPLRVESLIICLRGLKFGACIAQSSMKSNFLVISIGRFETIIIRI